VRNLGLVVLQALCLAHAHAYYVPITAGVRALFLQVGEGTMTGGSFFTIGVPDNNATINTVSLAVPAAALGSGTPLPMSTDSPVIISPLDLFAFCEPPATSGQVYVGGFYRVPGTTGAAATLSVSTPPFLTSANGDTIPIQQIAWTSSGLSDHAPTIPSGAFTGGTQTLRSVTRNFWFESCLAFRYLNTQITPPGTFTGRATFTLTAP